MSHIIIDKYNKKYEVILYDCVWDRCKNIHKVNTLEIFFNILPEDFFAIEYRFHKIDNEIWLIIMNSHKSTVNDAILYDSNNIIINEKNIKYSTYNFFILKSKKFNLYRNINIIPCLYNGKWNNVNESMSINTIKGEPLLK